MLNLHRDKKIVRREPGRDGKILSDHRQDGNDEVHRLEVRFFLKRKKDRVGLRGYDVLAFVSFVSHFRPMGLNVLGYLSPNCNVAILPEATKDLPISPRFSPYDFFHRNAINSSALSQLVNQWFNFTCSRSHAFRYGRKNENTALTGIEPTISAQVDERGYH